MRYVQEYSNDENWLYPNPTEPARQTMQPSHRAEQAAHLGLDPVELRLEWAPACEAAIGIADAQDFMGWMEDYIRPLLGYRLLACGTGVFLARAVSVERLLVRGIRLADAERLRDAAGTVVLPRATSGAHREFSDVDIDSVTRKAWGAGRPARITEGVSVVMERALGTHQAGSYFLFGALDRPVDVRSRYDLTLIAPHMHDALSRVLTGMPERGRKAGPSESLTRTERELLGFLVAGHTTSEIALETFRSAHTVANHVRAILRKLHAKNRTEAISKAHGLGLVESVAAAPQTRIIAAQPVASYRVPGAWLGVYRRVVQRLGRAAPLADPRRP